jgi:hypothetical protein
MWKQQGKPTRLNFIRPLYKTKDKETLQLSMYEQGYNKKN